MLQVRSGIFKILPGLVGGHCIGVDPYYLIEKLMMLVLMLK